MKLRSLVLSFLGTVAVQSLHAHGFNALLFTGSGTSQTAASVTALQQIATNNSFTLTHSTDPTVFSAASLSTYQVVIFLHTSGDILNASQETALQTWYQGGKGILGLSSSANTEPSWTWFHDMLGATQASVSTSSLATVEVLDRFHPISAGSAEIWSRTDTWANFTANPRGNVHVIATLEEDSYPGGTMGDDHPIVWCQEFSGGRSAYIGMGATAASFSESLLENMIVNSLEWLNKETQGDSGATLPSRYQTTDLATGLTQSIAMEIDPSGNVYILERNGVIKRWNKPTPPATAGTVTIITGVPAVHGGGEFGLLGIAFAPNFTTTGHVYLMYTPAAADSPQRLSRFTLAGTALSNEQMILQFPVIGNPQTPPGGGTPVTTGSGHHQGGCLRFDNAGNLYISVGDNTDASGFAPRNSGSLINDARKSAPNTNDLRGKILRVSPNVGGGPVAHPNYTIPTGNLFPATTATRRAEIYAMGMRNPFRFCIDPYTNWLYYGDVGPDAATAGTAAFQGPPGHDEFNQVRAPGNRGWPYYIGLNQAYLDANGQPWTATTIAADLGGYYTANAGSPPVVPAGDTTLPQPEPAWITYTYNNHLGFSEFRTIAEGTRESRAAMAGAVYQWQPGSNFPRYHDKTVFLMDYSRGIFVEVKTDTSGNLLESTRFLPNLGLSQPIDMKFGPDGAMYFLQYSTGSTGRLRRVTYSAGNQNPVAIASANVTSGAAPLTVNFSSAGSLDNEGTALTYSWNFGDGSPVSNLPNPQHTYTTAGNYNAQLTVTDAQNLTGGANVPISVGNTAPVVNFAFPPRNSFYDWDDRVTYDVSVTDTEDGSTAGGQIPSNRITFEASLGHVEHGHSEELIFAKSGEIKIERDQGHNFDDFLYYIFGASYTDNGAPGVAPVMGSTLMDVRPKVLMAQFFDQQSGVVVQATSDPVGGAEDVTSYDHNDWIMFEQLSLYQISALRLRASSMNGGAVEIRRDSVTGPLLGTVTLAPTSGIDQYKDFTTNITDPGGNHNIYFIAKNTANPTNVLRLNWINFRGQGITSQAARPKIMDIDATANNKILIKFDQQMDFATLSNPSNFTVSSGVSVSAAVPSPDQKSVILTTSTLSSRNYYIVTMNHVEDLAGDAIQSNSTAALLFNQPSFFFGLNAGGLNYTDAQGRTYVADTGSFTPPGSGNPPATLLVEFRGTNANVPAVVDASSFAPGDNAINTTAPVNLVNVQNMTNLSVNALNMSGVTISNTGANGNFTTNKGKFLNVPILDSYFFELDTVIAGNGLGSIMSINGIGSIVTGQPIKLTLWGAGDTDGSDAAFEVSYNNSVVGLQTVDYDAGTAAAARTQFTFNKVAGANSITIRWGRAASATSTAGFCGFSLTAPQGTSGGQQSYIVGTTSTATYTNPIGGTEDDLLYQTERFTAEANFGYQIPVPNGNYQVTLKFAENFFTTTGSRLFNANLESGSNIFSPALDIFSLVGKDFAYDTTQPVTVNDGLLNVTLSRGAANNAKISALSIASADTTLPPVTFAKFLEDHPSLLANPFGDFDGDGSTELIEYALGTMPTNSSSIIRPQTVPAAGNEFHFTFNRPKNLPDVSYRIVASQNLNNWVPLTGSFITMDSGANRENVEFRNLRQAATAAGLSSTARCFYRLEVSLIPIP